MKSENKVQVQGYFKLSAVQGDDEGNPIPGTERELCDWTPNLITDNGMELLKSSGFLNYLMVGSSSTAPTVADTTLGAFVTGKGASVGPGPSDLAPVDYPWVSAQAVCQFAKGAAAGNLSEIGIGKSQTNMFARALIKDTSGNPTTITVTSIELLTVTYQWRVYFDLTYSHTDTFVIDSVTYTTTTMVGDIDNGNAVRWNEDGFANPSSPRIAPYSGPVGLPGVAPSGSRISNTTAASITLGAAGNYYADMSCHMSTSQANASIGAFECNYAGAVGLIHTPMKCGVSPALVKDNTMELDITMRIAWARKVP